MNSRPSSGEIQRCFQKSYWRRPLGVAFFIVSIFASPAVQGEEARKESAIAVGKVHSITIDDSGSHSRGILALEEEIGGIVVYVAEHLSLIDGHHVGSKVHVTFVFNGTFRIIQLVKASG